MTTQTMWILLGFVGVVGLAGLLAWRFYREREPEVIGTQPDTGGDVTTGTAGGYYIKTGWGVKWVEDTKPIPIVPTTAPIAPFAQAITREVKALEAEMNRGSVVPPPPSADVLKEFDRVASQHRRRRKPRKSKSVKRKVVKRRAKRRA